MALVGGGRSASQGKYPWDFLIKLIQYFLDIILISKIKLLPIFSVAILNKNEILFWLVF